MARVSRFALAIVLLLGRPARADLLITEHTTGKAGGRIAQGVRSTYIKGTRMRIELVQGDQSSVTLYDLPGGTIAELDAKKKRAQMHDLAALSATLEKKYPRQGVTVRVTPTGATQAIAALPCEAYDFAVSVPMAKDGEPALTLTGAACIAATAPGADDYRTFARAAGERDLVIGYVSDNLILLAVTRGQTELYRALSAMPGVPYLVDMTIGIDGQGMLAGMLRKTVSGTSTATVTSVASAPLADALFAVPDDWKRERK
jgi:hypothetical protein